MDGVRTAAGWVRELQGRWLGSIGVVGGRQTVLQGDGPDLLSLRQHPIQRRHNKVTFMLNT